MITEAQKDQIIELKGTNPEMTFKEVAARVGCTPITASKYYKKVIAMADQEDEEQEAEAEEVQGKSVEDYHAEIIAVKDAHIASLERIITSLLAARVQQ